MIRKGDFVLLVGEDGKEFLLKVEDRVFGTHKGNIDLSALTQLDYGDCVKTTKGVRYWIVRPTLYDFIKRVKRQTQIIYPKDIGYIMLKLGVGPGKRVVECGTGSGALTMAFSYYVRPFGRVYTYEAREEFSRLARTNLRKVGLDEWVVFKVARGEDGFDERDVDAVFIDVKYPEPLVKSAWDALRSGGSIGFLLPTANQVSSVLKVVEEVGFVGVEVVEILVRRYKTNPERLRPDDMMVAHTGFLLFGRKVRRGCG